MKYQIYLLLIFSFVSPGCAFRKSESEKSKSEVAGKTRVTSPSIPSDPTISSAPSNPPLSHDPQDPELHIPPSTVPNSTPASPPVLGPPIEALKVETKTVETTTPVSVEAPKTPMAKVGEVQANKIFPERHLMVLWKQKDGATSEPIKRSVGSSIATLSSNPPVTLPATLPEEIQFELRSRGHGTDTVTKDSAKRITVEGWVGQQSGTPYQLEVKDLQTAFESKKAEGPTVTEKATEEEVIQFSVSGFSKLLSSNEESTAIVRFQLFGEPGGDKDGKPDENPIAAWHLTFMTPPSKVSKEQMTVGISGEVGGQNFQKHKLLNTLGSQLGLLQVFSIQNDSQWPLIAEVPIRLNGRLASSMTRIDLVQNSCSYSTSKHKFEEDLASELVAVPISDDLPRTFSGLINEALATGHWEVPVDPGKKKWIGLYASGPKAAALVKEGHTPQQYSTVDAVSGCRSRCGDPKKDMFHWDSLRKAHSYWAEKGWPGMSRVCEGLRQSSRIFITDPHPDENAMNQCAEWELSNGFSPWDERRFCQSPAPGNGWKYPSKEFWYVTKSTTPVTVGTKSGPLILQVEPDSTWVRTRFSFPGATEKAQIRVFSDFIKSKTTQAE